MRRLGYGLLLIYFLLGSTGALAGGNRPFRYKNPSVWNPYRLEMNVGIGGEALFASEEFLLGIMDYWYEGPESVREMHAGCYDARISNTYSLEAAYELSIKWSMVGSFGTNRVSATFFSPYSGKELFSETDYYFDILLGPRYYWSRQSWYSAYSQAQFGATFHGPGEYWNRNKTAQSHFGFQITALGFTLGERLYAVGEFGWGTEYFAIGLITGFRFGIGYRF